MKTITLIVLALTAVSYCQADNDGRYHPELRGGRYKSLSERNGKFGSNYNAYQPSYYQALNRELLYPTVSYGGRFEQATAFPTAVTRTPVTPVVSSTYRPFVYSTPKPLAVNTKPPAAIYQKSVSDAAARIIKEDRNFDENNYHYAYETNNGIAAEESGIVDTSPSGGGTRVKGFYEYIGDNGLKYRVDYIADENGFRASGAHLPKAP